MSHFSNIILSLFLLLTTAKAKKDKPLEQLSAAQIASGSQVVPNPVLYKCSKKQEDVLTASFYNETELPTVVINYDSKQFMLYRTKSGSGARYVSDKAAFWEHHGEANFQTEDKNVTCRVFKNNTKGHL